IRVSVLPTLFGEKVVMRLLDKSNLQLDMSKLGFDPQHLKDFLEALHKLYGLFFILGRQGVENQQRSIPRSRNSTNPTSTFPRQRILSSITWLESIKCRSGRNSGYPLPPLYGRFFDRTLTSSWSEKSVISKPPRSPSKPR